MTALARMLHDCLSSCHPILSQEEFYPAAQIHWFGPQGGLPSWADSKEKPFACLIHKENGTITTPFNMTVRNGLDRFHLVMDAINRLPQTADKGIYLKHQLKDKLIEPTQGINQYGKRCRESGGGSGATLNAERTETIGEGAPHPEVDCHGLATHDHDHPRDSSRGNFGLAPSKGASADADHLLSESTGVASGHRGYRSSDLFQRHRGILNPTPHCPEGGLTVANLHEGGGLNSNP